MAFDDGGNLWVTFNNTSQILRRAKDGKVKYFDADSPGGIVRGPDKNMWFTQQQRDRIGRVNLDAL